MGLLRSTCSVADINFNASETVLSSIQPSGLPLAELMVPEVAMICALISSSDGAALQAPFSADTAAAGSDLVSSIAAAVADRKRLRTAAFSAIPLSLTTTASPG